VKCFYLVGYHGCGKTTQANRLESKHPQFNYIGGKIGLDAIPSVKALVTEIMKSKQDMFIHGCIFQTEPTLEKLARLTDLNIIVMRTLPRTVEQRTIERGAAGYNLQKFTTHYSYIKKLPAWTKKYKFNLYIVDNNKSEDEVFREIEKICVPSLVS
jgi:adenylate kinase family enzyme